MKITIEIDQKELKELLDSGKEKEETDEYVLYFDDLATLLHFVTDANRVIKKYGEISWADLLYMLNTSINYHYKYEEIKWNKRFIFNERYEGGGNLIKMEYYLGGFKLTFPEPNEESK